MSSTVTAQPPKTITPETIVQEFKRSGRFDAIRKSLLEDLQSTEEGKALVEKFKSECVQMMDAASRSDGSLSAARQTDIKTQLSKSKLLTELHRLVRSDKMLKSEQNCDLIASGLKDALEKLQKQVATEKKNIPPSISTSIPQVGILSVSPRKATSTTSMNAVTISEKQLYQIGQIVAAFVLDDQNDSDEEEEGDSQDGRVKELKESCYLVKIERYDPVNQLYQVTDPDTEDVNSHSRWRIPGHKIVDFQAMARTYEKKPLAVGEKVYSLFNTGDEETSEFYQATVKGFEDDGKQVFLEFEDGDEATMPVDKMFRV